MSALIAAGIGMAGDIYSQMESNQRLDSMISMYRQMYEPQLQAERGIASRELSMASQANPALTASGRMTQLGIQRAVGDASALARARSLSPAQARGEAARIAMAGEGARGQAAIQSSQAQTGLESEEIQRAMQALGMANQTAGGMAQGMGGAMGAQVQVAQDTIGGIGQNVAGLIGASEQRQFLRDYQGGGGGGQATGIETEGTGQSSGGWDPTPASIVRGGAASGGRDMFSTAKKVETPAEAAMRQALTTRPDGMGPALDTRAAYGKRGEALTINPASAAILGLKAPKYGNPLPISRTLFGR